MEPRFDNMKLPLLVGYALLCIAFFFGALSQRLPDLEPIGRRGDVLTLGDVDDQTVFNVDNSGSESGKVNPTLNPSLDCARVIHDCQCYGPTSSPKGGARPGPGGYESDYEGYPDV